MAALTTLNITEKNTNNSLSVTAKVNVTKEGVFTTTLSKEDVDKIHSYGIKLPANRLGNEGYFNSIALSDLKFLTGSYEQFWIIKESVCPAIKGEAGYSKEEFDKVNKGNKDPELKSIKSFNDTVEKANEIKDKVLKYVDKIKQERAYNIDLCMTFERYIEIADKDAERAMAFLKEAYPFNEETEVFIRKRYNMSIDVDPEEN